MIAFNGVHACSTYDSGRHTGFQLTMADEHNPYSHKLCNEFLSSDEIKSIEAVIAAIASSIISDRNENIEELE